MKPGRHGGYLNNNNKSKWLFDNQMPKIVN